MRLLSVIVPVYNAEPWLDECLRSILDSVGQAVSDVEILLINDGSTDKSGEICDRYGQRFGNIRVFHKANGGVSSARNLGLAHAGGAYLAWVDPDDYVSPAWFPRIRDAVERDQPDVIVMDSVRFGNGPDRPEIYGRDAGFVDRDLFVADVIRDIRMLSGMPNKVMKATLFRGVEFDTTLPILEDYAAIPQILENARTVYYLSECLYHYRQHTNSLLHDVSPERAFQSVQIALARESVVEPKFRSAAVTAVALQAMLYCRSWYLSPEFRRDRKKLQFCKNYIRRNLPVLCADGEISKGLRIKMCMLALNLYGALVSIRNG